MERLLDGKQAFFVGLPRREQMEDNACEFVGGGGDRFGRAKFGSHSAEELAEIRLIAVERLRGHAQGDGSAVFDGPRFCRQDPAATDSVVGA